MITMEYGELTRLIKSDEWMKKSFSRGIDDFRRFGKDARCPFGQKDFDRMRAEWLARNHRFLLRDKDHSRHCLFTLELIREAWRQGMWEEKGRSSDHGSEPPGTSLTSLAWERGFFGHPIFPQFVQEVART